MLGHREVLILSVARNVLDNLDEIGNLNHSITIGKFNLEKGGIGPLGINIDLIGVLAEAECVSYLLDRSVSLKRRL